MAYFPTHPPGASSSSFFHKSSRRVLGPRGIFFCLPRPVSFKYHEESLPLVWKKDTPAEVLGLLDVIVALWEGVGLNTRESRTFLEQSSLFRKYPLEGEAILARIRELHGVASV